jgi:hypothetical protein
MHGEGSGNWRLGKSISLVADWCSRSDNGSYLIRFQKREIAASKGTIDVSDPIVHEIGGTIHLARAEIWCEYPLSICGRPLPGKGKRGDVVARGWMLPSVRQRARCAVSGRSPVMGRTIQTDPQQTSAFAAEPLLQPISAIQRAPGRIDRGHPSSARRSPFDNTESWVARREGHVVGDDRLR